MQASLLLVFCVVTILMVGLMVRLIYLTNTDGERYAKHVLSRDTYVSNVLPYKRGSIIDRNGTVLAQSELQYRLILDAKRLNEKPEALESTMKALRDYFEIDQETIKGILTDEQKSKSQYVTLLKNLKFDEVEAFKAVLKEDETIVGLWFDQEYIRTYPYNTLACDVLGFTSADNTGYWGIEEYYNEILNGTNGREYGYYDSSLNIERIVKKPVNGNTVITTLDANVQRIIQEKIKEFNTEFGSKNIGVLVMDPNNGGIIAMASNHEFDLNNPQELTGIYTEEEISAMTPEEKIEALNALWKNDVISSGFEPGSTFKPITIAAGLEESIVTSQRTFHCDGGEQVGGSYIHCNKRTGHGDITLGEALMYSCNDALMQIAAEQGKDIFYHYETALGLGKKTGIDLPGEASGILISHDKLNASELATSSFGQSFNVTMVQLAAAYSSLVNGGYYYQPHLLKKIVNDNGATLKDVDGVLVRQTVSKETSDFIQQYMYQTVENGTSNGAKVEGYSVGGKTGTAQKLPRDAKTYVVSFLGNVPAVNPEIVIYVMIDEPQNVVKQADSSIATKFASKILQEILPALGIYPEGDIDYLLTDDTDGDKPKDATSGGASDSSTTDNTNDNTNQSQDGTTQGTDDNTGAASSDTQGDEGDTSNDGDPPNDGDLSNEGDTSNGDNNSNEGNNSQDDTNSTQNNSGTTALDTGQDENHTGSADQGGDQNSTGDSSNQEEDEYNPDALD